MRTQSRLIMNPNGGVAGFDSAAADEQHEAVLRELTHGHELTAHLQAEALRALRGQGHAEATAAFILQEVSRAFTVCISIMGGSSPSPAAIVATGAVSARRPRDDGAPRKTIVTSSPNSDGYQWRKYGQKRIMRTSFPRCYYRCCYHRERSCPATKLVQQEPHSDGDKTMYNVIYVHEHTCHHTAPAEPAEAAPRSSTPDALGFSAGLSPRQQRGGVGGTLLDRGSKEELDRQALVWSLACVLQGHQSYPGSGAGTPDGSPSQGRAGLSVDASDDVGLDVMDYGVTDALYFAASSSYGPGGDGMIP